MDLEKKIDNWPYSSYKEILSDKPTQLNRAAVLEWFSEKEEFIKFHQWNPLIENDDFEEI